MTPLETIAIVRMITLLSSIALDLAKGEKPKAVEVEELKASTDRLKAIPDLPTE